MSINLNDYVDVATRMAELKEKHPDARLRPADLAHPYRIEVIDGQTYVVFVAACYRDSDDALPGIGTAWEPVPGRTPYTKGSEIQNAETSAWGRAIVAALQADTRKGVASREEVESRQPQAEPAPEPASEAHRQMLRDALERAEDLDAVKEAWKAANLPSIDRMTARRIPDAAALLHRTDLITAAEAHFLDPEKYPAPEDATEEEPF
jgi:hypothetical protein